VASDSVLPFCPEQAGPVSSRKAFRAAVTDRPLRRHALALAAATPARVISFERTCEASEQRFAELPALSSRSLMITGDNPVRLASIASEPASMSFVAERPEDKLSRGKVTSRRAAQWRLIAMWGLRRPNARRHWRRPMSASPCKRHPGRARGCTWSIRLQSTSSSRCEYGSSLAETRAR